MLNVENDIETGTAWGSYGESSKYSAITHHGTFLISRVEAEDY